MQGNPVNRKIVRIVQYSYIFGMGHFKKAESVGEAVMLAEHARLLTREMMQYLFKDAEILTERFFWLPKSFIAVKK